MLNSITLFLILLTKKILTKDPKLLFVYEHFRHGARAPCNFLDKDSKDIFGELWDGECELTKIGIMQHYILGKKNRERYKDFFNQNYTLYDILVYSTERDRCIQSAQAQLRGFFNNSLANIIPIHTIEYNYNIPVFYYDRKDSCIILNKYRNNNYFSPKTISFIGDFIFKYFSLLNKISNQHHLNINYTLVEIVCGAYICNYFDDRNISLINELNINKDELYKDCIEYNHLKHFEIKLGNDAEFSAILASSLNFKNLIGYMESIINKVINSPKYVLYSGHDTTLSSMQVFLKNAFNVEIQYIPFASQMVIHLIQKENGLYVNYYFNGKLLLDIPYQDFKYKIENLLWTRKEIENFCKIKKEISFIILFFIYSSIFLLMILGIIIRLLKKNYFVKSKYSSFEKVRNYSLSESSC